MICWFAEIEFFSFWQKTMDYSQAFGLKFVDITEHNNTPNVLLATTTTPNFIVFRCMVPKKWHENVPHTSVWGDGLQKCPIFMTVRQKRLNKICHFKLNEKRN